MDRRTFLAYLSASGLALSSAWSVVKADDDEDDEDEWNGGSSGRSLGQGGKMPGDLGIKGRVIVVGGGMAGTTAAKYLRLWGGTGVEVTLVEPNPHYYSNILSNEILVGEQSLDNLTFNYQALMQRYGVKVVAQSVTAIDPVALTVTLQDGSTLAYDRLILAPGIAFQPLPLAGSPTAQAKILHAWQAGPQTTALKAQIAAMTKQDTFILTIPPKPFRCPPGPYERACVVADYLQREKGGGKVIVLDANPDIQAGVKTFTAAFNERYKEQLTYVPNAALDSIDADTGTVKTSLGEFKGQVINAIPPQQAGSLITASELGLANVNQRWAGVDVLSYESTAVPKIHIIGDASATTQPKAGHIANAEAKVCVSAILNLLKGVAVDPNPVTNSACFSPIASRMASWLTVVYRYDKDSGTMKPATAQGAIEASSASERNYKEMQKWFDNLMSDTFA